MRNSGIENFSENYYITYSHNQVNEPSSSMSIKNNVSRLPREPLIESNDQISN